MTAALELAVARQIGEFNLDVAFTVESGMSVLFGPSGAGKSLTLALIAGLIRPDSGTITINGHVVTDCSAVPTSAPKSVASAWSSRTVYCCPTARLSTTWPSPSVRPGGAGHDAPSLALGSNGSERKDWPTPTGISVGWPTPTSGPGPRLAGDPALILLDEPLSALDAEVRRELRELIRGVIISSSVRRCW